MSTTEGASWPTTRRAVIRNAVGIGAATGAYAVSFGAISTAAGLSVVQTMVLSLLMFTGGSQFALVGVIAGGGNPLAGAAAAVMLGSRNALYGMRLAPLLDVRGWRRVAASHWVIDETTAMAIGPDDERTGRLGFYATGMSVFTLWNLGTAAGAVGAEALQDPSVLGLDAAAAAAFVALLGPRLRGREPWAVAGAAAIVAVVAVPLVPPGVPVLVAALVAVAAAYLPGRP
ncbi:MAG: AzlC family ABC transporter permease [Nakamurella sp.]